MRTFLTTVQLLLAMLLALLRASWHRLRRGPAVEGWSWTVELRAAALRSFIMAARDHADPNARDALESRYDPPIPRRLRSVMRNHPDVVGGVTGEWVERTGRGLRDIGTMLYLHGGAYVAGSPATHREWVARLTWAVGCRTFVPDYRLAPEHLFPAALDDAVAVYEGLLADGIRPDEIVLAGDSAGGGLATALLLRLRDEGRPLPAGAVLFSPYVDLTHSSPSIVENIATDYLPVADEIRPNTEYLGSHDPTDPHASPVFGDFTGIPPLLILAGGREMILDDSTRLAQRATAGGCDVTVHVADDMYHVWPAILPGHPESLVAEAVTTRWVGDLLRSRSAA